jgi:acyl carrier protein
MSHQAQAAIRTALATIAPEADPDTLDPDEDMPEALDLDSVDFLNFLIAIRDATGVDVPESDAAQVRTFSGCVAYLSARMPE